MGSAELQRATEILNEYGPWALVVILLLAISYLYRHMNRRIDTLNEHYGNLLEKRHDQFIEVLTDSAATLKQCKDEIKDAKDVARETNVLLAEVRARLDRQ